MKTLRLIAYILLIIGGLNWGLIGIGVGDVVGQILGSSAKLLALVYDLVGLSAIWFIFSRPKLN